MFGDKDSISHEEAAPDFLTVIQAVQQHMCKVVKSRACFETSEDKINLIRGIKINVFKKKHPSKILCVFNFVFYFILLNSFAKQISQVANDHSSSYCYCGNQAEFSQPQDFSLYFSSYLIHKLHLKESFL